MLLDDLFRECFGTHSNNGQTLARSLLRRFGYAAVQRETWCYGAGDIPVLLVAHTDTVFSGPPATIYHDKATGRLWGDHGIGADDRAGVWGIARLLRDGYRPHVLFTDLEEVGAVGAQDVVDQMKRPPVNYLIQLDRRGSTDAVFYGCRNQTFQRYVTGFGFDYATGSFSDISVLAPAWNLAAVNLSCGYYQEHTSGEHLMLPQLEVQLDRVAEMLELQPDRPFRYQSKRAARKERRRGFMEDWRGDADWRYR